MKTKSEKRNPWLWVPSSYFMEGLPYVMVMSVSVIMYKKLNISNTDIALYTSWLYLPWVIKPLWSPFVDIIKTKRIWIVLMQLVIGGGLAGVALTLHAPDFFRYSLAFFWLLAFSSATHDIAVDGFYLHGLSTHEQAFFVGIRSTFYRIAMLSGQGLFVMITGILEKSKGSIPDAWSYSFLVVTVVFICFAIYHQIILPYPLTDIERKEKNAKIIFKEFAETFVLFFKKEKIWLILFFILFYRLGEAQLVKIAPPFLLDSRTVGGLGFSTEDVGFIYGTVGVAALVVGGLLGGFIASKKGLKFWIWWMLVAINVPDILYVYMSTVQPESFIIVCCCVAIEQFGYGIGFTAFMLYLMYASEGKYKTAHFAIATGFMALGMMIPGMISGWLQEQLGYQMFFVWVFVATIPAFIITKFISIDPEFGKKKTA
ncbi:MAG: MFS transporter [bacterium]